MEQRQLSSDVQRLIEGLAELPEPVARPVFIVVSGLPGTGKSYFARRLREWLPCALVSSDDLRRRLFLAPSYSAQESRRLFQVCHLLIEYLLSKGLSVILDATNLLERHREHLYRIADRLQLKLVIVRVEAPPDLVQQRLKDRLAGADPLDSSEANFGVYQKMRNAVQRIRRNHFVVDTSRDITPVIDNIVREARR